MLDSWNDWMLLVVGWLLGLLAPAIVDGIRRRRQSGRVRQALRTELREARLRIAAATYFLQIRFGQVDRALLEWVQSTLATSQSESDAAGRILKSVSSQLALTDEHIAALAERHLAGPEGGVGVKKYALPLLDARVASIWELDCVLQRALLNVRANLDLFNEEVDQARFYFALTFEHSDTGKRERIDTNLRNTYVNIATRGKIAVDAISIALDTLE